MVSVLVFAILLVCFAPCLFNFFLLLFDQETLHRIIVIVLLHQERKLPLLGKHRTLFFLFTALFFRQSLTFPLKHVLPTDLELVWVLVIARLVSCVIDLDKATANIRSAKVVYCQVGTSLVFVLEPSEPFGLARFFITDQF